MKSNLNTSSQTPGIKNGLFFTIIFSLNAFFLPWWNSAVPWLHRGVGSRVPSWGSSPGPSHSCGSTAGQGLSQCSAASQRSKRVCPDMGCAIQKIDDQKGPAAQSKLLIGPVYREHLQAARLFLNNIKFYHRQELQMNWERKKHRSPQKSIRGSPIHREKWSLNKPFDKYCFAWNLHIQTHSYWSQIGWS